MTDDVPHDADALQDDPGAVSSSGRSATVLLFVQDEETRRQFGEWLADDYDVLTAESPADLGADCDLVVVDEAGYRRHRHRIGERTEESQTFLPVLLTASEGSDLRSRPEVWDFVDDLVRTQIQRPELRARIESLVDQRRRSLRLHDREQQLQDALADLRVKERAIDAAPIGITITAAEGADNPLTYVNRAFEDITGYDEADVLGRDPRFLQGPETASEPVDRMRKAIDEQRQVSVELINYEQCGRQFWNRVDVAPVADDGGEVTHYVGFQTDVTDRKIREQRLNVLNRVLRHNLRNGLEVVQGYAELLEGDPTDAERQSYLDRIHAATSELATLSETVHDVERTMQRIPEEGGVEVTAALEGARSELREDDAVDVEVRCEDLPGVPGGATVAFRELLRNALDRCGSSDRTPEVVVSRPDDYPETVEVVVRDGCPDVPDPDRDVLEAGEETALDHADGLGLWLVDWVARASGGTTRVSDSDRGESAVAVRLPVQSTDQSAVPD